MEEQWEFCELVLRSWKRVKVPAGAFRSGEGWVYDCYLRYYKPAGGEIHITLGDLSQPQQDNPWPRALARLGLAGWELVSVQHGNTYGGAAPHTEEPLTLDNRIAYLKRRAVADRPINDAHL